jgi:hypothetical protein
MALPNFELYENLKKDMSEESARMIAEVFPQAADLATKGDIDRLEAATRADIVRLEAAIQASEARLKAYIDSRLLRYTAMILIPVSLTMLGSVGALIALVVKLH